jgi:citrate lyase alpha subunit
VSRSNYFTHGQKLRTLGPGAGVGLSEVLKNNLREVNVKVERAMSSLN